MKPNYKQKKNFFPVVSEMKNENDALDRAEDHGRGSCLVDQLIDLPRRKRLAECQDTVLRQALTKYDM